ncbi:MAG: NAD(P)-binding domain-containing protein, partial [Candidatus Heimdallarchaeaceae archaeon]
MKYFTMDLNEASNALKNRSLTISVFGLGKMGLPICTVFLEAGFKVIGVDISPELVEGLNHGLIPLVGEPGVEEGIIKALEKKQFSATLSVEDAVKSSDIIVIIIPILVDDNKQPHLDPLKELLEKIGKHLEKGHLIIQETTLPIGTTEGVIKPLLEEISGLKAGEDFGIGFSPERTYSGRAMIDITVNYPKIVGGFDSKSTDRIAEFYETFVEKGVIKMSSAT